MKGKWTYRWVIYVALLAGCAKSNYTSHTSINSTIDSTYNSSDLEKTIDPYRQAVDREMNEIIGFTDSTLVKFAPESPLGNFVADVIFETGMSLQTPTSFGEMNTQNTLALLNFGGLRAPLNKGNISVGNVYELMPFDNTITIVRVNKTDLNDLLDYLFEMDGQPVANARCTLTEEIRQITIGNQNVDSLTHFYIITSDYLATGGDKMNFLKNAPSKWDSGVLIRDAIIANIRKQNQVKFTPVEGRINLVK